MPVRPPLARPWTRRNVCALPLHGVEARGSGTRVFARCAAGSSGGCVARAQRQRENRPTANGSVLLRQAFPAGVRKRPQQICRHFHAPKDEVRPVFHRLFHWLTVEHVQQLHYKVMAKSDDLSRADLILDQAGLEAAVAEPLHAYHYGTTDPFELAAVLCYHIAMRHTFLDGNKRTGLYAACVFLELNGFALDPSAKPFDDVLVDLVTHRIELTEFADLLRLSARPSEQDPAKT